jgi:hypothetical protein
MVEKPHLAQSIENVVEEQKDLAFGNLGDIVHALTCVVTHASILISEASQDWWYDLCQISSNFILLPGQQMVRQCCTHLPIPMQSKLPPILSNLHFEHGADELHRHNRDIVVRRSSGSSRIPCSRLHLSQAARVCRW